jgi:hypothetical protein
LINSTFAAWARDLATSIQVDASEATLPPQEGLHSQTQQVLPRSLTARTKGYIERVVEQVNSSYEHGSYDACAVMIRRLVETLIIECFESKQISQKIKDSEGNFFMLRELVDKIIAESNDVNGAWNLGRKAKEGLKKIKDKGDLSAHNRRFVAQRTDIDGLKEWVRVVVQELVIVADIQRPKAHA